MSEPTKKARIYSETTNMKRAIIKAGLQHVPYDVQTGRDAGRTMYWPNFQPETPEDQTRVVAMGFYAKPL